MRETHQRRSIVAKASPWHRLGAAWAPADAPLSPSSLARGDAVSTASNELSNDDRVALAPAGSSGSAPDAAAESAPKDSPDNSPDDSPDNSPDDSPDDSIESSMPLVWVEAEQVFVARGFIYRVHGRSSPVPDSETLLDQRPPDAFTVLSSRSPAQLAAMPPSGWARIEPAYDLDVAARIGDSLVVRRHGGNEYTVVHTTAAMLDDPPP
jgi:hypothetical protein